MSHKPNLLSWDQDVAASPREFHETDNRTNSVALLATWQYFSFRHIRFSKLLSYQKLSQIILSYFSNALSFEQSKIIIFCKNNGQKNCPPFWKSLMYDVTSHWYSDQSTNVYPWRHPLPPEFDSRLQGNFFLPGLILPFFPADIKQFLRIFLCLSKEQQLMDT